MLVGIAVPGMGHLLGYARVSTTDQQPQLQVDALEHAGCYRVFTETATRALPDRPILEQVLDQLRPGDTLVAPGQDARRPAARGCVDLAQRRRAATKLAEWAGHSVVSPPE
jgi:DNA invertase Pin-like site-specific DNA recombinase